MNDFKDELDDLVLEGQLLAVRIGVDEAAFWKSLSSMLGSNPASERDETATDAREPKTSTKQDSDENTGQRAQASASGGAPTRAAKRASELAQRLASKDFNGPYQSWFSRSSRVVAQLIPERHKEFVELYKPERAPKELDPSTYSVSDYVRGITVVRGYLSEPAFDTLSVALTKVRTQIDILQSARDVIESRIADITGILEAGLLDDELDAARELYQNKYLRSAGVVAGVALERHLKRVFEAHKLAMRKKAQLANLNDALKDAAVLSVADWRFIQRLADIRNVCAHAGEREPRFDEVEDLIAGTAKVISTVF